ncbi:hypothetical protein BU17DRAFT_89477 [Hysterangium stoloniferum]|nr:hypothetical protein BU17DRAFT_89477 [Hysterangium stoloniferum]
MSNCPDWDGLGLLRLCRNPSHADGPRWNNLIIRLRQYKISEAVGPPMLTYALQSIKPDYAFLSVLELFPFIVISILGYHRPPN